MPEESQSLLFFIEPRWNFDFELCVGEDFVVVFCLFLLLNELVSWLMTSISFLGVNFSPVVSLTTAGESAPARGEW